MSGFGKLNIDFLLLFARLVYEENSVLKNFFCNVSFVRASCEEQSKFTICLLSNIKRVTEMQKTPHSSEF